MTQHYRPIYRPTVEEVLAMTARIISRYPHLESRCRSAEQILAQPHGIEPYYAEAPGAPLRTQRWTVASLSRGEDARYWILNDGCNCLDYITRRATAHGRAFCKHLIAFYTYRQILLEHAVKLLETGHAELDHGQFIAPRTGVITLNFTGGRWRFATDHSAAVFAVSLPRIYTALEEPTPAVSSWPPSGHVVAAQVFPTSADRDHYIRTGEIPALRTR